MTQVHNIANLMTALSYIREMPLPVFFASSRDLPADKAMTFMVDQTTYVGAHPDLWATLPDRQAARFIPSEDWHFEVYGCPIADLDKSEVQRTRFYQALGKAISKGKKL